MSGVQHSSTSRLSAWAEAGRIAIAAVGVALNALAMVGVFVGVLAQGVRDEERATDLAPWLHLGYVALNLVAIVFLLTRLADETSRAVPTVLLWAGGSAALWSAYWLWVL